MNFSNNYFRFFWFNKNDIYNHIHSFLINISSFHQLKSLFNSFWIHLSFFLSNLIPSKPLSFILFFLFDWVCYKYSWYSLSFCYYFIWEHYYYLNSIRYFLRLNGKWNIPILFSFHKGNQVQWILFDDWNWNAKKKKSFQVNSFQIDIIIHSNHIEWELTLSSVHHKSHHCFPFWSFILFSLSFW